MNSIANGIHSLPKSIYSEEIGNPYSNFPWKNPSQQKESFTTGGNFVQQNHVNFSIKFHLALIVGVDIERSLR